MYNYIAICIYRYHVYVNTCVCMYVDYAWTYVPISTHVVVRVSLLCEYGQSC